MRASQTSDESQMRPEVVVHSGEKKGDKRMQRALKGLLHMYAEHWEREMDVFVQVNKNILTEKVGGI